VLSTAVAVGAIFPIGLPSAAAETRPVAVETAAWFWAEQVSGDVVPGVPYPDDLPPEASGIKPGNLAVAFKGETEVNTEGDKTAVPDKETYLSFDIYDVPAGSIIDQFAFTLFLDPTEKNVFAPEVAVPGQTPVAGQPVIIACRPKTMFGQADGDSFDSKPEDDCSEAIYGEFDATKQAYTFHAETWAQDWVDGLDNFGVALRPALETTAPFQLSFLPAEKVAATIAYTPAQPVPTYAPPTIAPVVPLPPVPTDTAVFVPDTQPVQPQVQPQPTTAPRPVVMPRQRPIQNVAASPLTASRALSPVFWLAMAGGVLLLGTMSLILGDPLEPVSGTATRVRTGGRHRLAPAPAPGRSTRPIRPRTV
jgi:hypothetical protein